MYFNRIPYEVIKSTHQTKYQQKSIKYLAFVRTSPFNKNKITLRLLSKFIFAKSKSNSNIYNEIGK